ncbi:MAG: hypothetical protein H0V61_03135 [Chitinophagales bacterium]|nr:hypothetical protein [Chitinophagales bacterium]
MSIFILLLSALSPYLIALDHLIVNNSLSFSEEQTDCYRRILKSQLYNKLKQNPSLRQGFPYNNFYSTTSSSSIGNFWIVDSLISILNDTSLSTAQKEVVRKDAMYKNDRITVLTQLQI